jgi:hypothetical protein
LAEGGAAIGVKIGLSAVGKILAGVYGVGAVSEFQQTKKKANKTKKRPGKFRNVTEAAIDALKKFNILSIEQNREYAGSICERLNGEIFYTTPNQWDGSIGDEASSIASPCPSGTTRIGHFHTHGAFNEEFENFNFSSQDRKGANLRALAGTQSGPSFLATPSGSIKRFDPAVISSDLQRGKVTRLRTRTPIP